VPHSSIPELDHDSEAQRLPGVSEDSIQASYFLISESTSPLDKVEYIDRSPPETRLHLLTQVLKVVIIRLYLLLGHILMALQFKDTFGRKHGITAWIRWLMQCGSTRLKYYVLKQTLWVISIFCCC
jgi:hypothetical protein